MASKGFSFLKFISRLLLKFYRNQSILHRTSSASKFKFDSQFSALQNKRDDLSQCTCIFDVQETLLKSSTSVFSYFMLIAFEAGSLVRVLLLFLLYPLICVVNQEASLKIMVFVCFAGINKERFIAGSVVLPKFLLEDVCLHGLEVVKKARRRIAVSDLPQVMIDCFLKDYLEIDVVVGRDLKVRHGYFLGLMEDRKNVSDSLRQSENDDNQLIGITSSFITNDYQSWSSICKENYMVNKEEKESFPKIPKEIHSKPVIFHDGRLALKPTPLAMMAILIWIPFGIALAVIRAIIAFSVPLYLATPILAFSGFQLRHTKPKHKTTPNVNRLYASNHRTLMDPIFISFSLQKPLTAVTYSMSKLSEIISPIRTVRLKRDRNEDWKMMEKLLKKGDIVVCPEGTTCREPYLLRFSPLFTELSSSEIVPVGVEIDVSMFHGTTAGGLKCLDPFFFCMNPSLCYNVKFLESVSRKSGENKFDVANRVQSEIGKALGFKCTTLTRKDKYLILAGNEGIVS